MQNVTCIHFLKYLSVVAGLVRKDEVEKLNINDFTEEKNELLVSNWWLPLAWGANIVKL